MDQENAKVVERYWEALRNSDMQALAAVYAEDAVQEWPQSRERIVGRKNIVAVNENYPGMPKATPRNIIGRDDLWVSEVTLDYGAERYESVSIFQVKDGKVVSETDYFAAPFEAPEWRAQWVERM